MKTLIPSTLYHLHEKPYINYGMPQIQDLSGMRYGRLVVLWTAGRDKQSNIVWACQCECGNVCAVRGLKLKSGRNKSCGCLRSERYKTLSITHGHTLNGKSSAEYNSYTQAKFRCNTKSCKAFKYYGARGIEFRFSSFEDFMQCLGPKPSPLHSLERIDNNGHYEVGNVRWATMLEQAHNRRPKGTAAA